MFSSEFAKYDALCAKYAPTPDDLELISSNGLTLYQYDAFCAKYSLTHKDVKLIWEENLTLDQYDATIEAHKANMKDILTVNPTTDEESDILSKMEASFRDNQCIFVTGVYHKTSEGTCEIMPVYSKFIEFLREKVQKMVRDDIDKKVYVIYLGTKDSKATHPKIVKKIRQGEFIIASGGLIVPGFLEPAAVTTLDPFPDAPTQMQTFVMGSAASNFHKFLGAGLTLRSIGCQNLPQDVLDYVFTTAEQVIQAWKAIVADKFKVFRAEGTEEQDGQHAEALKNLLHAVECRDQKKLGRKVQINFKKYGATAGKISVRIFAFILAARIAGQDEELRTFMRINRLFNNEIYESAIHDAEGGFSGKFPDTVWGSTFGSPHVFLFPDQVVCTKKDAKTDGVFGKGIALFQAAMNGDGSVLASLNNGNPVTDTEESVARFAAALFEGIWAETSADAANAANA